MEAPTPDPLETATEEALKPRAGSSALQITTAAALSGSCANITAYSPVAAISNANGKANSGTLPGVLNLAAGPAAHQSCASGQDKDSTYLKEKADPGTPSRAVPVAAAAAASASQSAAAGSGKGSQYPLGSLEVWGAQWGAVRLACRKLAAVPHQQRVSACLAVHAQEALWTADKVGLTCSL